MLAAPAAARPRKVPMQGAALLRRVGRYRVSTPNEPIAHVYAGDLLVPHPLCGGTPRDLEWSTLHLVADEVLPRLG
jgi:hypothetical protein